ncbi:SRP54-type protein [Lipomyces japonicus]|uniref:SRP54-type protein n=1 Tax=Lipomyces japonicus TaxID=56871 RepID=UPI0034CFDFFA
MIDHFGIFTTGGVVLWQKTNQPVSSTLLDSLVSEIFIEDKTATKQQLQDGNEGPGPAVTKDRYTVKWITANDFGIIIFAVYQSLLQITFIDELLASIKKLFTSLYGEQLKIMDPQSLPVCKFDDYFALRYAELERRSGGNHASRKILPSSLAQTQQRQQQVNAQDDTDDGEQDTAEQEVVTNDLDETKQENEVEPTDKQVKLAKLIKRGSYNSGRKTPKSRSGRNSPATGTADVIPGKRGKQLRKWDSNGLATASDDEQAGSGSLDFSTTSGGQDDEHVDDNDNDEQGLNLLQDANAIKNFGSKIKSGEFLLRDLSSEIDSILSLPDASSSSSKSSFNASNPASSASNLVSSGFGFFKSILGGSKTLTEKDLNTALANVKDHLMKKNVAPEAAQYLCDVVKKSLSGTSTGTFTSVETTVRAAMEEALRKILTPSTSLDLLHEITAKKASNAAAAKTTSLAAKKQSSTLLPAQRPYVISVVGVNGVGKSTNLSKIAFWLLQNDLNILIAACDTFRSGAVEQLRVHVKNLQKLTANEHGGGSLGRIELYEKGYSKDSAVVARDAIAYGADHQFDVVLIDTAGRRHNDARLMSSLEKFAKYASPDKIVMVGEALVGTDSVQQARNFNAAFGTSRGLDFFLISKCDTVGDMIGSIVNMTYSAGIPVLFVGTGQMYTDLRTLSIPWAVNMLMA